MNTFKRTWNNKSVEDAGSTMSKEANSFVKAFKNMLSRELESDGIEIINFEPNHYDCSGFLKKDNNYIYISYSIPRGGYRIDFNACNAQDGVLYRTAESDRDYRGGFNNFSSLYNLPSNIRKMFDDYERYK